MQSIDINCDLGESYGNFIIGNDEAVFPYLTSCNIACGFHGGDPYHIERTIDLALKHEVQIGAHPSYPDLMGFGRRKMTVPFDQLSSIIKYQVSALKSMTESKGAQLIFVKPHGALYNSMVQNEKEASVVIDAIKSIDSSLVLMCLANSPVEQLCKKAGMKFAAEAFADRRYTAKGTLMSRSIQQALIQNPEEGAAQVLSMVLHHEVTTNESTKINLNPDSICIHGDNPAAVNLLKSIHQMLLKHHITIKSFVK